MGCVEDGELQETGVLLDVTSKASVEAAVHEVTDRHGVLDVLINNAGILPGATAKTDGPMDAALFEETFDTNVF